MVALGFPEQRPSRDGRDPRSSLGLFAGRRLALPEASNPKHVAVKSEGSLETGSVPGPGEHRKRFPGLSFVPCGAIWEPARTSFRLTSGDDSGLKNPSD